MTERDREHEQSRPQGDAQGQGQGGRYGAGPQSHGGYGQGSYGYGQGLESCGGKGSPDQQASPGPKAQAGSSPPSRGGSSRHGPGSYAVSDGHRDDAPSGHQCTDERLREMICERLMEESSIDANDVAVTVLGGRVSLEGRVDSRMAKYQIEDMVETMGVNDVQNNLRFTRDQHASDPAGEPTSQSGSSGGVSSLGMSGSGVTEGDRTSTGGASAGGAQRAPASTQ